MPGPGQIGIHGPFEIPYEEGLFVPVPHNLVEVGSIFYRGEYKIVGNILFFIIIIAGDTGADTTAATAGVTYFEGLPLNAMTCGSCIAANEITRIGYGTGMMGWTGAASGVYPPSWPAVQSVQLFGWYYIG